MLSKKINRSKQNPDLQRRETHGDDVFELGGEMITQAVDVSTLNATGQQFVEDVRTLFHQVDVTLRRVDMLTV